MPWIELVFMVHSACNLEDENGGWGGGDLGIRGRGRMINQDGDGLKEEHFQYVRCISVQVHTAPGESRIR